MARSWRRGRDLEDDGYVTTASMPDRHVFTAAGCVAVVEAAANDIIVADWELDH